MPTSEERTKILNMVAEGKINAEEAASLLKALKNDGDSDAAAGEHFTARTLHVRVTNTATGKVRANVSIPISLVDVGMRMGAKFAPDLEGLDLSQVVNNVRNGARGKILEIDDDDDNERVEIFVE
jgi:hypothetical protein